MERKNFSRSRTLIDSKPLRKRHKAASSVSSKQPLETNDGGSGASNTSSASRAASVSSEEKYLSPENQLSTVAAGCLVRSAIISRMSPVILSR